MIYDPSTAAVILFIAFVTLVLLLSYYFSLKTKTSSAYFAAGGTIHWGVNGIAFAGDYLSAASFLGICGMIAFSGYDGFLYSIGFLAGWVVALFIVAEPLKRMGKYTFTDALDAKYNSRGIKLAAAVSTLVVSMFYLIPQMVGAGDLVVPLLGLPHWAGVTIVGSVVIFIVATAGMTSTTYVQFIKGGLLIVFSIIITGYILNHGLKLKPDGQYHEYVQIPVMVDEDRGLISKDPDYKVVKTLKYDQKELAKVKMEGVYRWFMVTRKKDDELVLDEMLSITHKEDGTVLYNGAPREERRFYQVGHLSRVLGEGHEVEETGALNPFTFLSSIEESEIVRFERIVFTVGNDQVTAWYQNITSGKDIMTPGLRFDIKEGSVWERINFISLMLALFLGTSALPHILIRYYTVPSERAARKSTIVAIAAIGFFYILTMYLGLGAMVTGVLDMESSNMSAPLLARYFGVGVFSVVSAIAFATVLGTVSGLIVASSGAIAHDFFDSYLKLKMTEKQKVMAGKLAAFGVGIVAIILGILFRGMNVSFLVGLAFAVAASANLPSIVMILFWKKTNARGITASIITGVITSVGIILLSPVMFERYGLNPDDALIPLDNPGIISIPLSFLVLIVVSLATQKKNHVPEQGKS